MYNALVEYEARERLRQLEREAAEYHRRSRSRELRGHWWEHKSRSSAQRRHAARAAALRSE